MQGNGNYAQLANGGIGLRKFGHHGSRHVLCFPHAGGQSLAFGPLADALSNHGFACSAVDPPGHGWATGELQLTMRGLVLAYLAALPADLLRGAVLFGHSMGAHVALHLALALLDRNQSPRALVLSAARPPHLRPIRDRMARLPDDELLEALLGLGGIPEACIPIFSRFAPVVRADFSVLETSPLPARVCTVPTLVLGGTQDTFCRPEHVVEWTNYLYRYQTNWIEAPHLFVQSHPSEVAECIAKFIERLATQIAPQPLDSVVW